MHEAPGVLPGNLLRHTPQMLAVSPPSIARLRSIDKRRQTLSKHQLSGSATSFVVSCAVARSRCLASF